MAAADEAGVVAAVAAAAGGSVVAVAAGACIAGCWGAPVLGAAGVPQATAPTINAVPAETSFSALSFGYRDTKIFLLMTFTPGRAATLFAGGCCAYGVVPANAASELNILQCSTVAGPKM